MQGGSLEISFRQSRLAALILARVYGPGHTAIRITIFGDPNDPNPQIHLVDLFL